MEASALSSLARCGAQPGSCVAGVPGGSDCWDLQPWWRPALELWSCWTICSPLVQEGRCTSLAGKQCEHGASLLKLPNLLIMARLDEAGSLYQNCLQYVSSSDFAPLGIVALELKLLCQGWDFPITDFSYIRVEILLLIYIRAEIFQLYEDWFLKALGCGPFRNLVCETTLVTYPFFFSPVVLWKYSP